MDLLETVNDVKREADRRQALAYDVCAKVFRQNINQQIALLVEISDLHTRRKQSLTSMMNDMIDDPIEVFKTFVGEELKEHMESGRKLKEYEEGLLLMKQQLAVSGL
jgi:hypothetical protein